MDVLPGAANAAADLERARRTGEAHRRSAPAADAVLIVGGVPAHNLYVVVDRASGATTKWMDWNAQNYPDFAAYLEAEVGEWTNA